MCIHSWTHSGHQCSSARRGARLALSWGFLNRNTQARVPEHEHSHMPALELPCVRPRPVSGHKAEAFSLEGRPRQRHDSVAGTTRLPWQS